MDLDCLEEFGRSLVLAVRDPAIQTCDERLVAAREPAFRQPSAAERRWSELLQSMPEEVASSLIPDIVDEVIKQLLFAIDQHHIELLFVAQNGKTIELRSTNTEFGALHGMYDGFQDTWREKYSVERYANDGGGEPES